MNERGFTLLESMIALALTGMVLAAVTPSFFGYMDANTRNEERSGAIASAQQQMERLRHLDPVGMPSSGTTGPEYVTVDGREYEVVTRYCSVSGYCGTNSRHLAIEVNFGGRTVFKTETVFSRLR